MGANKRPIQHDSTQDSTWQLPRESSDSEGSTVTKFLCKKVVHLSCKIWARSYNDQPHPSVSAVRHVQVRERSHSVELQNDRKVHA